jgi:hypothetical protein
MFFKLVTLLLLGSGMALMTGQSAVGASDLATNSAGQSITAGNSLSTPASARSMLKMAEALSVSNEIQEDPDLSGEPGTPRRTQGSGTR